VIFGIESGKKVRGMEKVKKELATSDEIDDNIGCQALI
jgi:hypothetical protein